MAPVQEKIGAFGLACEIIAVRKSLLKAQKGALPLCLIGGMFALPLAKPDTS